MSTFIYLSNDTADISGYKKAYIGYRSPNASTTLSTTVTATTSSGTSIQQTLTSGGTAAKWITVPLKDAVTIAGAVVVNFWGLEDASATNSGFQVQLAQYTTSAGSAFMTGADALELTTTAAVQQWSRLPAASASGTYTSTAFAAGDRLIILPYVANVGTMAVGTATMDYNGATEGADGDTYIMLNEIVRAGQSQVASGLSPAIPNGPSAIAYGDIARFVTPIVKAITANVTNSNPQWLALMTECEYQGNLFQTGVATENVQSA